MKSIIKKVLSWILGFENFLFIFSIFIINTLRFNKNERDFLQFLKLIPDDGIVLDVGANIGIMTVHLARKLKRSKIFAFEPVVSNIRVLKRVVSFFKLDNVKIFETALGNEEGEVEMVMPVLNSIKMQGLCHVVHESITGFRNGETFNVPIKKLDNIEDLKSKNILITAIKLDVENFEYFVLEGAKDLIEKHRPCIYSELWDNQNRNNCFILMQQLGYKIEVLENGDLTLYKKKIHKTQNFFFTPAQ